MQAQRGEIFSNLHESFSLIHVQAFTYLLTLGPIKTLLTRYYHSTRLEGHARFVFTEKLGLGTTIGCHRIFVQSFAADAEILE